MKNIICTIKIKCFSFKLKFNNNNNFMRNKLLRLNNGEFIPVIGLGTYGLNTEELVDHTLTMALELGYRHFDTASIYNNEHLIGNFFEKLFKTGKYKRSDIYIGTKLWNADHDRVREALDESLSKLKMSYVDYYYVHWPIKFKVDRNHNVITDSDGKPKIDTLNAEKVWLEMEKLVDFGLVHSLGGSNFNLKSISKLISTCNVLPNVIQVECHPYLKQRELKSFCDYKGIVMVASAPLGGKPLPDIDLRKDSVIKRIAKKNGISPSQVILSYTTMKGICVIPKTTSYDYLKVNINLIQLSIEDFDEIDEITQEHRFYNPVSFGPYRFI